MEMVVVRTVGTRFEAELLGAKLGAHGVLWQIRSRQLVPTTHPIGFLDVMVPADELDAAEEVLAPDEEAERAAAEPVRRRPLTPAMLALRVALGASLAVPLAVLVWSVLAGLVRALDVVP